MDRHRAAAGAALQRLPGRHDPHRGQHGPLFGIRPGGRAEAGPGGNLKDPKIGSKRKPLLQVPENEIRIISEIA